MHTHFYLWLMCIYVCVCAYTHAYCILQTLYLSDYRDGATVNKVRHHFDKSVSISFCSISRSGKTGPHKPLYHILWWWWWFTSSPRVTPLLSLHREVCYIGASPCCSGNILLKKKGELLPLYPYLEECMLAYVLPRLLPQHKSVIMGWCVEKVLSPPKKKH